ncbi:MAG: AAA family ATPase [Bacteroidetes bacterium]|nr:AAA family ATPase [Bacteroidota bacterium]MCB0843144.1 AAA family ATPase [Bacteroidota bacterium]
MIKIPYGTSNFSSLIEQEYYYIDRTHYLERIENLGERYIVFLRPRRFGKSLWISTLQHYYGIEYKDQFDSIFGKYYIGKHPTSQANHYLVLRLDFSGILTQTLESTFEGFLNNVKRDLRIFGKTYKTQLPNFDEERINKSQTANEALQIAFEYVKGQGLSNKMYVIIDEYDHFANELLAFHFDDYQSIVSRNGYVRKFYEALKTGTGVGIIDRIFITGVSPITLDSFTSGFNIARNLTTDLNLHELMGFTTEEVEKLMLDIGISSEDLPDVMYDIQQWYNGYLFNEDAPRRLYNPDMVMYFALEYQKIKRYPKTLLDTNIASDYGKLHRLFRIGEKDEQHYDVIEELVENKEVSANLTTQYSFERNFNRDDFISMLFYLGMITIKKGDLDGLIFHQPNYVIGELYFDYFREIMLQRAQLSGDKLRIRQRVIKWAQENNPAPFIEAVEAVLSALSNRDSMGFNEKHVKTIFTSLLYTTGIYTIKSEYESEKKYVDLLLKKRPPIEPNFTFAIELKYLKKSESDKLGDVKSKGIAQLKAYLQHEELQKMQDLKAWLIIFVGSEAREVVEV